MLASMERSIGETKESSLISEIRDSADHAGLSLPLLPTKATRSKITVLLILSTSQSSSLSTVLLVLPTTTTVATEVLPFELSNISETRDKQPKLITHTRQSTRIAKKLPDPTASKALEISLDAPPSRKCLLDDPWL